jgi:hypothetical protein
MRRLPRRFVGAVLSMTSTIFWLAPHILRSAEPDVAKELRSVFEANLKATEKRDLKAVLATVHPKSATYAATETQMRDFFEKWQVKSKLLEFKYIATDEGYAIARTKFKTVKVSGPPIRDNTIDAFCVFKKDGNHWKIWQQANLEFTFVQPPPEQKPAAQTPPAQKAAPK